MRRALWYDTYDSTPPKVVTSLKLLPTMFAPRREAVLLRHLDKPPKRLASPAGYGPPLSRPAERSGAAPSP